MVITTLQKKFSNFFEYQQNEGSDQFINFESGSKSRIHLKLSNGIVLPHESNQYEFDDIEYEKKYKRRIERFNKIVYDKMIKKNFVRADDKVLSEKEKEQLKIELEKYGCNNFDIIYICYKDFKTEKFTWERDYILWKNFFS